jgi:hypothetical protein
LANAHGGWQSHSGLAVDWLLDTILFLAYSFAIGYWTCPPVYLIVRHITGITLRAGALRRPGSSFLRTEAFT